MAMIAAELHSQSERWRRGHWEISWFSEGDRDPVPVLGARNLEVNTK